MFWKFALLAVAAASLVFTGGSCINESSPGIPPPPDRFTFPSGLLLDPRVDLTSEQSCQASTDCNSGFSCVQSVCRRASRHLFVVNANSDRSFHSGTVIPIDLDRFFAASGVLKNASSVSDQVLEPGKTLSAEFPCRRVHITPQVIECEESYFAQSDATINIGNFAAEPSGFVAANQDLEKIPLGQQEARALVPVRGDPSITWFSIRGGYDNGPIRLECGQSAFAKNPRDCGKEYRLSHLFGDFKGTRIAPEPFKITVSDVKGRPIAFVSHLRSQQMTLISLDGVDTGAERPSGTPQIVDSSSDFIATNVFSYGYGIVERPCTMSNPSEVPASTQGCTRPLLYAAFRNAARIGTVTAVGPEIDQLGSWQHCVDPKDLGQIPGGIDCNIKVKNLSSFSAPGLPVLSENRRELVPVLSSLGFGTDGTQLYAVQTRPGGLIRIDTRVNPRTEEPVNAANTVLEICSDPAEFEVYRDATADFGLVSCYRSAEIFIVDLTSMLVVKILRAGTGAHEMTVDQAREVVYVANFLESTISVIDMSRERPTRFSEIARIGLQETYVQ